MKYFVRNGESEHVIEFTNSNDAVRLILDDENSRVELSPLGKENLYSFLLNNQSYELFIQKNKDVYSVSLNGRKYEFELEDEKTRFLRSLIKTEQGQTGKVEMKAPMPGLIVKINVSEGQTVATGDALFIIEAMKMENEIRSHQAGTVSKIFKQERDSVDKDTVVMVIE